MSIVKKVADALHSDSDASKSQDATKLLRADHKLVDALFREYESSNSKTKKRALIDQICEELMIHAQIEEEVFYPKVKDALHDEDLIPEARVEHETLEHLISQLNEGEPGDEEFDAKVTVLAEYVRHHVKEEQSEIFPKAKATDLDMKEIGAELIQRKEELKSEAQLSKEKNA